MRSLGCPNILSEFFNITRPSTLKFSNWSTSSEFPTKTLCSFFFSPIPATCPAFLILVLVIPTIRCKEYDSFHYTEENRIKLRQTAEQIVRDDALWSSFASSYASVKTAKISCGATSNVILMIKGTVRRGKSKTAPHLSSTLRDSSGRK